MVFFRTYVSIDWKAKLQRNFVNRENKLES